jgi:hypothetical protein
VCLPRDTKFVPIPSFGFFDDGKEVLDVRCALKWGPELAQPRTVEDGEIRTHRPDITALQKAWNTGCRKGTRKQMRIKMAGRETTSFRS